MIETSPGSKAPRASRIRREPAERIIKIHRLLKDGAYVSCTSLADGLGVSVKTMKRDIQYMRDYFDLPIAYSQRRRAYHYSRAVPNFPGDQSTLTDTQLFALLIARKALTQYKGTRFHEPLSSLFADMTSGLAGRQSQSLAKLDSVVSFRTFAPQKTDSALFAIVQRAAVEERALRFDYRKPGEPSHENRTFHPYHLTCSDGRWYVIGHDAERGAIRTFALSRLRNPQLTTQRFCRPPGFDPAVELNKALNMMSGNGDFLVEIEFDAWATDILAGRTWHHSQVIQPLPHGGCRLSMRLGRLEEVIRWILSWGDHAIVLGPQELLRSLAHTARGLAARYAAHS